MAVTQNTYTGNGSTVLYSFTFPYLETTDVKVTVNGTITTAYTFANATTIQFNTAPLAGAAIRIYRQTDDSSLRATFYSGSAIRAQDLNDDFTQNLYVAQEVNNNALDIDGSNPMVGDLNMGGYKVTNLATPVAGTDAANRSFVEGVFSSEVPVFYRRWSKTAAGGETSLSGNDDNGIALSYVPGSEKVFINGALQVRGVDYSGTTGSTLTGIPALTAGDIIEVHSSSSYTVGTVPDGSVTNAKVEGAAAIQSTKLAFIQNGTGAVTRTVESKLRDVVSVKDFGAVGNGVADDTAALTAMFNHCNSQGLSWHIPAGNYLIQQNNVLTVKTGGTCEGKLIIPKANRSAQIKISRDSAFAPLSTAGWNALNRDSLNVNALNAYNKVVLIDSTEVLTPRNNPPTNIPYYKQELIRCVTTDGAFNTPLVNTYNPVGSTITVTGATISTPITIKGLHILVTGANSGSGDWSDKVRIERDRVTLEDLTVINDDSSIPFPVAVNVVYSADVVFVRPFITGLPFSGAGYGIQFSTTIGCQVSDGTIEDCIHAITGRHNCDLVVDGGTYSYSIDDHWGDRMVIKNLIITSPPGYANIMYSGNDITVSNVTTYGGRVFFGFRADTPSLGGTVSINKVKMTSQDSGEFWFFGTESSSYSGVSGTYPIGFIYKRPDLLTITDVSLDIAASTQFFLRLMPPSSNGSAPAGAWESWKQINVSGPFNFVKNTPILLAFFVKDGSLSSGTPSINIDGCDSSLPSGSIPVYASSLDTSTTGRALVNVKNVRGNNNNYRYSGYAVGNLTVSNCQVQDFTHDNLHPVSGCFSIFSNCEFRGTSFPSTLTDCLFSSCLFSNTYTTFPSTRCAWIGNTRVAAQGALPTDIRANVLSPFL
jgi:hypothetical protein